MVAHSVFMMHVLAVAVGDAARTLHLATGGVALGTALLLLGGRVVNVFLGVVSWHRSHRLRRTNLRSGLGIFEGEILHDLGLLGLHVDLVLLDLHLELRSAFGQVGLGFG